ncbi:hypothetical protein [Actinacidiphila paucisporea]|uniref:Uncharacterized protein n=1 Tax=Actinacidiphila paucisporea TaxID=310782 RepID=A0A1M7PB14_9ACTN|nr:hypothetical protein [Actinacidiphila paucisporea]SHN13973.1 hypothetical protein SAMN05216499_12249 [Actinacidiphila paucisporea]
MSEQHPEPAPAAPLPPEPLAPAAPAWPEPEPAPPARSKERRDLLVAGALLAVAALAGAGYLLFGRGGGEPAAKATPSAVSSAAPTPAATRAYGVTAGGTHYGDLGELLLPMQPSLAPGPDDQQYGNDTVLDAAQAKSMAKGGDGASQLTAKERRQVDAELDAMHIKGSALRTFRRQDGSDTYELTIVQVGNKLAAGAAPEAFRKLSERSDVFGKGPAVPGHPHAVCVVPGPSTKKADDRLDWLDALYCQATEGDLMVTFRVEGPAVDRSAAVALMARQLDRIQAPGEGV